MDAPCAGCANISVWGRDAACLWQRVFKPVPPILARAQAELQALYNTSNPKYAAAHLRLGGLAGEADFQSTRGGGTPLTSFAAAVSCAQRMKKVCDLVQPTMILADSQTLRNYITNHTFPDLVAPAATSVHLDRALGRTIKEHQSTVVDLVLLARAACLVTSPSGFSHHAWLAGGGKQCQRMFNNCSTVTGGPGGGPPVG